MTSLRFPRPVARPARRLVCFPWAGASASVYRAWAGLIPGGVELVAVQYPGREDRMAEPFATDLELLADAVVDELCDHAERSGEVPTTLFGHSAGASVALASARLLERDTPGVLSRLVVSGRRAPGSAVMAGRSLSDLDEAARDTRMLASLRSAVAAVATVDDPGLELSEELLRDVLIPVLRADLLMLERYDPRVDDPVTVPLAAYGGDADPTVPTGDLDGWAALTKGPFTRLIFPGDHFYLVRHRRQVLDALVADLSR